MFGCIGGDAQPCVLNGEYDLLVVSTRLQGDGTFLRLFVGIVKQQVDDALEHAFIGL